MKKKKTITAPAEPAEVAPGMEAEAAGSEGENLLAELGAAFLARLNVPEGMSTREAVEAILASWERDEAVPAPAAEEKAGEEPEEAQSARNARLPKTLRGGLGEAPEADYESMSAEQFRRLKKQLQRAAADGRRIRL